LEIMFRYYLFYIYLLSGTPLKGTHK